MAFVTSQYYLQNITDRLNDISVKLGEILSIMEADKQAKSIVAFERLSEWSKETSFYESDISELNGYYKELADLRAFYKLRLNEIKVKDFNLDTGKFTDKKEAELKIQKLKDSEYFYKLENAIRAEVLCFIASTVGSKIACNLGRDEDVKIYAGRMSLDFWNNYADQFNRFKHDVVNYLEIQSNTAIFNVEDIKKMKDQAIAKFDDIETRMLKLPDQLNRPIIQYIKFQKDGSAKKYIPIDNTDKKA